MATKIPMVCLGNICRSPLAEGILQSKLRPREVIVDSAGTGSYHLGKRPDKRSIGVARKYGIDISRQRCRQFTVNDFRQFDVICAMDKSNYHTIGALATDHKEIGKVQLLTVCLKSGIRDIPDHYHGQIGDFEKVFQMLDSACDIIASRL